MTTVAAETTKDTTPEEEARAVTSGIPTVIRNAPHLLNETWQSVDGAHTALHDALDLLADAVLNADPDDDVQEGLRKILAASLGLMYARRQLEGLAFDLAGGAS